MNSSRLLLIVAGCGLLSRASLSADDTAPPFVPNRQFSADMAITDDKGQTFTQKIYSDNGKMRMEMSRQGMQMVMIVRPDQQKIYQVAVARKMVMELPYDADRVQKKMGNITGPEGKFEDLGPDTQLGVTCTKYKVTSNSDNKAFFFWVDAATKAPVMMMAVDDSVTVQWKNYKAGPQAPSLFEPPADYQVITVPAMPGASMGNTPDGPVVNH